MTGILQQLTQCHDCFNSFFCFCMYTSIITKSHKFCEEQTVNVCFLCTACSYCNIELAFLLDSSTKSADAWRQILEYTVSVIAGYNIHPSCVRVAVISYSDSAEIIELNRYNEKSTLQDAVRRLPLLGGGSNLANAFNVLYTRVFASNVIRPGASLIAVVVTDSPIQWAEPLISQVNSVKGQGTRVIGVGIRLDTNSMNALYAVSSNRYAVSASDYNQLPSLVSFVTQRWGCFPPPPPLPTTTARPPAPGRCSFM